MSANRSSAGSGRKRKNKKKHTGLKAFIVLGLILSAGMSGYVFAQHSGIGFDDIRSRIEEFIYGESDEDTSEIIEEIIPYNPLTGVTDGFDENALHQRPVAFVVENTPDARPQWGMDDPEYSPDIILQGEVEGGITRTLWFYADYNKLPEIIGPMRSARPPYIKFSELFDSYFIHWGQSHSKGDYVGANTVFRKDKVDHINQMKFTDTIGLFGRDQTRAVSMEHRGILYGDKVPDALSSVGFRSEPAEYTRLDFDPTKWLTTFKSAYRITLDFSNRTNWDTMEWNYDPEDMMYHSSNFRNDLARDNLIILYDDTEYIDLYDYQGIPGYVMTYCNYKMAGGDGMIISHGVMKDITWRVEDGKLVLVDKALTKSAREAAAARAAEEESDENADDKNGADDAAVDIEDIEVTASLNKGKTWIGWVSRNNEGRVDITSGYDLQ